MTMKLEGMDELLKSIANLEKKVSTKIKNEALKKGAEILKDEIRREAPKDSGILEENINVTSVKGDKITIHTGKAYHAHLVEFGRSAGTTTYRDKNGVVRPIKWGRTSPNAFMQRSFENKKDAIEKAMADVVRRGLGL